MNPLISVIVPVYNVEKYLDRCVTSIIKQTYKNLEIILVDDGSPDSSGKICDEWAKKTIESRCFTRKTAVLLMQETTELRELQVNISLL